MCEGSWTEVGLRTLVTKSSIALSLCRIFYNNRMPFFAFVGVNMASGAVAIITKDDELEGVCWEIRDTVVKMHQSREKFDGARFAGISLEDLKIGPNIGQGCSAVVYAAALREPQHKEIPKAASSQPVEGDKQYPFALKMMFNYDIQSNALIILRAMYRETIPARTSNIEHAESAALQQFMRPTELINLPPHANIVTMFSAFCAQVPDLENAQSLYPMALPPRLFADGYGRNMSLFLLMKRYTCTLDKHLQKHRPYRSEKPRHALLLFAQLLEAVAHLYRHGISHRDLKSDNLLVEHNDECPVPLLVVTDFGCCLADRLHGFHVPYTNQNVDKGGNAALMAPEIITKQAGPFAVLNYSKADLWATGTIAYEMFGERNPFLANTTTRGQTGGQLRNYDYRDTDLPALPDHVPWLVRKLVENILQRNPKKVIGL